MARPNLIVAGIEVPLEGSLRLTQNYEWIGGRSVRRTMNGSALEQRNWKKLRTTIAGGGWMPDGLASLEGAVQIDCVATLSVTSPANLIALPTDARGDVIHFGWAWAAGQRVTTPVAVAGRTATLTVVPGATRYMVEYWPSVVMILDPVAPSQDLGTRDYDWQITAEEQ